MDGLHDRWHHHCGDCSLVAGRLDNRPSRAFEAACVHLHGRFFHRVGLVEIFQKLNLAMSETTQTTQTRDEPPDHQTAATRAAAPKGSVWLKIVGLIVTLVVIV